ncbi:hypothetical protein L207DRAFT_570237 [Hyaloscypha variabilis F]|uniref:Uncharacterized protein n=1 Tax=Hyaloscypha variabilis (strain UAMH 11265 / GT02V1 / F) TaxID=1149755 RepID=A0A2J6R7N9_HYAVF|nr:hypothetical protein L207DRAFT_570237 [Hyaloscypha variabilis F]
MTPEQTEGTPSIKQESLHVDEEEVIPTGTSTALRQPPQPLQGQEAAIDPTGSTAEKAGPRNRILFKPAPEFHENTGLHSAVVNFNPPRRAHCARVPDELDLKFDFPDLNYNGKRHDHRSWSYQRAVKSSDLERGLKHMYVVFGIFPGGEARPVERLVVMKSTEHLLWRLWWEWVRLRGMRYIFSLKGVKGLGLYECNWLMGTHIRIPLDPQTERILNQLYNYFTRYHTSSAANRRFADWVHENLNHSSYEAAHPSAETIANMNQFDKFGNWQPRPEHSQHDENCALSLELVIGWSTFRVSLAVLAPVTLSLVVGAWYQKATGDVGTAWVLATYVITTAGILAALLALLTGLENKS